MTDANQLNSLTMAEIRERYEELMALEAQLDREVALRRLAFMERLARESTMPDEQAKEYADHDRAAFDLPLADWAKVKLLVRAEMLEKGPKGLVRFYPHVGVKEATKTGEWRELFERLPKTKKQYT